MGALVVSNSRDGSGGAAPAAADVRANSMPSTLGEALQRAQMEQHMAQLAAGELVLAFAGLPNSRRCSTEQLVLWSTKWQ